MRNFVINLLIIQIFKDISAKYLGDSFKLCVFHTLEVKLPDRNHHVCCFLADSCVSWSGTVLAREEPVIVPWDS